MEQKEDDVGSRRHVEGRDQEPVGAGRISPSKTRAASQEYIDFCTGDGKRCEIFRADTVGKVASVVHHECRSMGLEPAIYKPLCTQTSVEREKNETAE